MHPQLTQASNNSIDHQQLANMLVTQAVQQLEQITKLPESQCRQLIQKQFHIKAPTNLVINQQEIDFITQLFT